MRPDEALRVLGVSATATPAEIKAAYRRLVKAWHPDRHGGDEQRSAHAENALKQVLDAYQCLKAGVPPPEPSTDPPQSRPTAASMFSIRPAAPFRSHRVRRADGQRWERRLRHRRRLAIWLSGLGVVVALAATWSKVEPLPKEQPPPEPLHPIKVRATRTGRDWSMVNLSNRSWFRCRAWVGAKMLDIPSIEAGQTLVLKGSTFDPRLSEIDDERELDVLCAR